MTKKTDLIMSEKYVCKTKILNLKLETLDPTGMTIESQSISMEIIDDENCMRRDRLYLTVGKCIYHINAHGHIIETVYETDKYQLLLNDILLNHELYSYQKLKKLLKEYFTALPPDVDVGSPLLEKIIKERFQVNNWKIIFLQKPDAHE